MVIDETNNIFSFLQTVKDIDGGINSHDITVLPEGEIGVLPAEKRRLFDKICGNCLEALEDPRGYNRRRFEAIRQIGIRKLFSSPFSPSNSVP